MAKPHIHFPAWTTTYTDLDFRTSKTSLASQASMLYTPKPVVIVMAKGQFNYSSTILALLTRPSSFVEFETAADFRTAVEKLDGREFKGVRVTCVADVSDDQYPADKQPNTNYYKTQPDMPRDRARSRSPGRRGPIDDYDRRGPPRGGYSPRRDSYRERSPRRDYYDDRRGGGGGYRSPPRARGPPEDYPVGRRGGYDEPYRRDYPPADPYVNGAARPYERGPPRDYPPRDGGYPRDYDRRY